MEMNDIITFITNLGFPIVCVFALWQSIKDYMKEQKEEIIAYIDSLSDEEKERYKSAIKIVLHEIELRQHSLSNRKFFRNRAMICYKLAYIKTHMPDEFTEYYKKLCSTD